MPDPKRLLGELAEAVDRHIAERQGKAGGRIAMKSSRRMFRYDLPVDVQKHTFYLTSSPVKFAAKDDTEVEFWAEWDSDKVSYERAFRVFGTGHQLPDDATWVGTCDRTPDGYVWHLFEVAP